MERRLGRVAKHVRTILNPQNFCQGLIVYYYRQVGFAYFGLESTSIHQLADKLQPQEAKI